MGTSMLWTVSPCLFHVTLLPTPLGRKAMLMRKKETMPFLLANDLLHQEMATSSMTTVRTDNANSEKQPLHPQTVGTCFLLVVQFIALGYPTLLSTQIDYYAK